MSEIDVLRQLIDEADKDLWQTVEGAPQEVFERRPAPGLNPPGFIYFHLLRHWDRDVAVRCLGREPEQDIWHQGGFSSELDYEPLGKGSTSIGTGFGYSEAEVDATPKDLQVLMRYHRMLQDETTVYLDGADDETLHEERTSPHSIENPYTPERWLRHLISHTNMHIGDIQYALGAVTTLSGEPPAFDADNFPGSPPSA